MNVSHFLGRFEDSDVHTLYCFYFYRARRLGDMIIPRQFLVALGGRMSKGGKCVEPFAIVLVMFNI